MIHRWTPSLRAVRSLLLVGLVAGSLAACSDSTDPTPTPTGTITVVPELNMRAEDISSDGKTILMTDVTSPTADFWFYDIATNTSTLKGSAGDALFNFTTGVSNAGRVSAIHGKPEVAGLWQEATGWLDLGNIYPAGCEYDNVTLEQNQSGGWDIDSAGHTAVGLVWNVCDPEAFLWTDAGGAGGFVALDLLGDSTLAALGPVSPPFNRATVISDDGLTAGGFASESVNVGGNDYWIDRRPALWTSAGLGSMIPSGGVFTDDCPGEVLAIAGNGSLVAGRWCQHGFLWSAATGTVDLTPAPSAGYGQAVALNGQLVFGTSGGFPSFDLEAPFVWTQAGGVQSLIDIADANGITLPTDYSWIAVVAASADGTVVVGTAYDESFNMRTVVLKMPVSAYGL